MFIKNLFTRDKCSSQSTTTHDITYSRTKSQLKSLEHYWTIEHYRDYRKYSRENIHSVPIIDAENDQISFSIQHFLESKYGKKPFVIGSYSDTVDKIRVEAELAFVTAKGRKVYRKKFCNNYLIPQCLAKQVNGMGIPYFIELEDFKREPTALERFIFPNVLQNGEITVYCKITYVTDVKTIQTWPL